MNDLNFFRCLNRNQRASDFSFLGKQDVIGAAGGAGIQGFQRDPGRFQCLRNFLGRKNNFRARAKQQYFNFIFLGDDFRKILAIPEGSVVGKNNY